MRFKQSHATIQEILDNAQSGGGGGTGTNYITVGDVRLYVSNTEPTGDIPNGAVGVGW